MSTLDYVTFSTAMTVVMLIVFIGIIAWAYSGKRRQQFDEAARVPFDEDAPVGQASSHGTAKEKS